MPGKGDTVCLDNHYPKSLRTILDITKRRQFACLDSGAEGLLRRDESAGELDLAAVPARFGSKEGERGQP